MIIALKRVVHLCSSSVRYLLALPVFWMTTYSREEGWGQKPRQRSSRVFGRQNLFHSLPRSLFCRGLFKRKGGIHPIFPNFAPQTDATTFTLSSNSILLLLYCPSAIWAWTWPCSWVISAWSSARWPCRAASDFSSRLRSGLSVLMLLVLLLMYCTLYSTDQLAQKNESCLCYWPIVISYNLIEL